ncbi:hypothetical protein [Actinomadura keratinilytica]|jgi:hypothetical protein|uniref:hypothetical protein n=1 Tax=Actinomadura keratinilytica TaxID=547461 RepID=UPI00360B844B
MQRAEFQTSRHSHRAAVGDGQLPADISLTDNRAPGRMRHGAHTSPSDRRPGHGSASRDRVSAKTDRRQQFIATLLQAVGPLPVEHHNGFVLGGDYNVIGRDHRPAHTGFLPFEYGMPDSLRASGLVDAHGHCHPADQPHN